VVPGSSDLEKESIDPKIESIDLIIRSNLMLKDIFGNATAEKVLLYLEQFGEGYARQIASNFDELPVSMVNRQLHRFERAGVLVSQPQGNTRMFRWSRRSPFVKPLRELLRKALQALPEQELQRYFVRRRRPRVAGKPR
jgi:DNA-binding transcriptional ArsR family regulator